MTSWGWGETWQKVTLKNLKEAKNITIFLKIYYNLNSHILPKLKFEIKLVLEKRSIFVGRVNDPLEWMSEFLFFLIEVTFHLEIIAKCILF
jgi:hypothetical protein